MGATSFTYVIYIASTPEKVWDALTKDEWTEQYFFGRRVKSGWKEGSEVVYLRENDELDVVGKVLKNEQHRVISFTWGVPEDPTPRDRPTHVTFELVSLEGTVKVTLRHENLLPEDIVEDADSFYGLNNGWPAILSNLKSLLETGKTLPAVKV